MGLQELKDQVVAALDSAYALGVQSVVVSPNQPLVDMENVLLADVDALKVKLLALLAATAGPVV